MLQFMAGDGAFPAPNLASGKLFLANAHKAQRIRRSLFAIRRLGVPLKHCHRHYI